MAASGRTRARLRSSARPVDFPPAAQKGARGADRHAELVIASGAGARAVVESAAGVAAHNGT